MRDRELPNEPNFSQRNAQEEITAPVAHAPPDPWGNLPEGLCRHAGSRDGTREAPLPNEPNFSQSNAQEEITAPDRRPAG